MLRARRALVSVSDKTDLAPFAQGLTDLGIEILSTGGTLRHLADNGVEATAVADATGSPEILGGRVKTLHPRIHGGILADRGKEEHLQELDEQGIVPIDIVAVNLYPFQLTIAREGIDAAEAIENIDIGGPCMTRAAAKNYRGVVVVVDPADYPRVLEALREGEGWVPEDLRQQLALKAFQHTQEYDTAIASWMASQAGTGAATGGGMPESLTIEMDKEFEPRYGENPHQASAIYRDTRENGIFGGFEKLQGKELSWNNMLDADAARKLVSLFAEPTVVIVKHNNPCGVGRGANLVEAYQRALACDPVSAFGSIIAVNREADEALAEEMRQLFVEVVIAPSYDDGAREIYGRKKNLRVLVAPLYGTSESAIELRGIDGGFLAQTPDGLPEDASTWECVTERQPTDEQRRALEFAWKLTRYTKSNAIILTNADQSVGIGAGQMSRVDSCRIAIEKAALPVAGTVAGSDAFFPVPRRLRRAGRGGRCGGGAAGGVQGRRGGHRRSQRARHGHALHRPETLPPLRAWIVALLLAAAPSVALRRRGARGARGAAQDAWSALDTLRGHLHEQSPFRAGFVQTFVPEGFSSGEKESGRMALALPECLRWDYDEPYPKSFLLCGDVFHYWNPGEDEGHTEEIEAKREPGLDLLLLEVEELRVRYRAELSDGPGKSREIRLRPLEPNEFVAEALLRLNGRLDRLLLLRYLDPEGNVTEFAISGHEKGAPAGTFNPPEGIEWLDEW